MTSPTGIHDALVRARIDPERITSRPGRIPICFATRDGGRIEVTPVVLGSAHGGWSYTRHDADGEIVDAGGHSAPPLETLLISLRPHLDPLPYPEDAAAERQVRALRAWCSVDRQHPITLHPASPAARWILALFLAWTDLRAGGDGVNGADLTDVVGNAFHRIGLTDEVSLEELALDIDHLRPPHTEHAAIDLIAAQLQDLDRRPPHRYSPAGAADVARQIVDGLHLDGHLVAFPSSTVTDPHYPTNEDRSWWGVAALDALTDRAGARPVTPRNPNSLLPAAADLIASMLHLADRAGLDPDQLVQEGRALHRVQARVDHDPLTCSVPGCLRCPPPAGPGLPAHGQAVHPG